MDFSINLCSNFFDEIDEKVKQLQNLRPFSENTMKSLRESNILDWTYNSNAIEGIDDENAGKYRNENVIISGATHIPPDHTKISELMEELVKNYSKWDSYHPIVKVALLHGEFVKIHPFIDGNGRTARLIMNLDLMQKRYVPVIIKKENRLEYYESLDKAHITKDYTDFVKLVSKAESEMLSKYVKLILSAN